MEPVINDENEDGAETDQDRTDGEDSATTPSQSRSPSVHPAEDDSVDVFDGYSFKGRHSVILDDEDEDGDGEDEDEDEEEESIGGPSLDDILPDELPTSDAAAAMPKEEVEEVSVPEDIGEPKTPEARPAALPSEPAAPVAPAPAAEDIEVSTPKDTTAPPPPKVETPRPSLDEVAASAAAAAATRTAEDANVRTAPKVRPQKPARNRREKSGIPALDKDLPDTETEGESAAERDDDDDDWDFVEAGGHLEEERNGAKGTSLFARGVVDRYKLAVFRKSTPRRSTPRSFSGLSVDTDVAVGSEASSPTPSDKRRGRTPLTFRKHPKQFLRQQQQQPSQTPSSRRSAKSLAPSGSAPSTVSSAGLLTPSTSTMAMSPSLKSKESALSMGAPSEATSDASAGDGADLTVRGAAVGGGDEEKQQKNKVLKKYKEGAEKVLSIFQSPR